MKQIRHIRWLWTASSKVYPGVGALIAWRRSRFVFSSIRVYAALAPLLDAPAQSSIGKLMRDRPETVGAAVWPYQCAGWNPQTRFARIRSHYSAVEKIGGVLDFPIDDRIALLDLTQIYADFYAILEQPAWFMREGQLSLSLFLNERRIYTLAFSLFEDGNKLGAFIGAMQGRDIAGALDKYRELTKAAHGMRPRDLLFEIFRMFCAEIGVQTMQAVSEDFRHHKDKRYFGDRTKVSASYDEIWADRGGVRADATFYELKVYEPEKDLSTIPAKKRGMYRRRFELLRSLREQMHDQWGRLTKAKMKATNERSDPAHGVDQYQRAV
jgi:uncharacterized protein